MCQFDFTLSFHARTVKHLKPVIEGCRGNLCFNLLSMGIGIFPHSVGLIEVGFYRRGCSMV